MGRAIRRLVVYPVISALLWLIVWVGFIVPMGLVEEPARGKSNHECQSLTWSPRHPPDTIRVWVPHKHMIWHPTLREYILRVMSAGAAPTWLPEESLKVMALSIYQYSMYEIMHPSEDKRKRAGCYDIKNGGSEGQYVWPYSGLRPYTKKQEAALDSVWGITLWKPRDGSWWYPRLGWLDGYQGKCGSAVDRWHFPEDEITDCAKKGWGWKRILTTYLSPVKIEYPIRN